MRHISLNNKFTLFLNGCLIKIGFIVWLSSTFLFLITYDSGDIEDFRMMVGSKENAKGFVTYKESTSYSEDGEEIYLYYYNFSKNEEIIAGQSYGPNYYDIDNEVKVEFLKSDPEASRIIEQHNTKGGLTITLVIGAIFLITSFFFVKRILKTREEIIIFKRGEIVKAQKVKEETTNVTINDSPQYKLTYDFLANGVKHQHYIKTMTPDKFPKKTKLIYLPENPKKAFLKKSLPKKLKDMLKE